MDSPQELINFMENTLISTNNVDFGASAIGFLFALIFSFILKNMYLKYSTTLGLKAQISEILTLLALIIFILITVVKSSLALSLGLVGALSIVRFRTPVKDPEDLVFLFASITIGIGFGAGQILITSVGVSAIFAFIAIKGRRGHQRAARSEFLVSVSWEGAEARLESLVSLIAQDCDAVDCIRLENSGTAGSALLGVCLSDGVVSIDEVSNRILESLPGSTVSFFNN